MLTGILLAGGKSNRMQQNKAFLKFRDLYLFEFPLAILRKYCDEILISTSDPAFHITNHILVNDDFADMGPISGIYSCLKKSQNPYSLILPCDLPLLDNSIADLMLGNYEKYDITVPINYTGFPEPLIGVYSKKLIQLISKQIKAGELKLQNLLFKANTNYINLKDEGLEIPAHLFRNINTLKDYKELTRNYE